MRRFEHRLTGPAAVVDELAHGAVLQCPSWACVGAGEGSAWAPRATGRGPGTRLRVVGVGHVGLHPGATRGDVLTRTLLGLQPGEASWTPSFTVSASSFSTAAG